MDQGRQTPRDPGAKRAAARSARTGKRPGRLRFPDPTNRSYVHQMRVYEGNTLRARLSSMHRLRHPYAQKRYEELTGCKCPATGGPDTKSLTPEQRELDREQVATAYLGC